MLNSINTIQENDSKPFENPSQDKIKLFSSDENHTYEAKDNEKLDDNQIQPVEEEADFD